MVQMGAHVGQQNMTMGELRSLWQRLDRELDWISVWDHIYEVPPAGGTQPHFEALTTLAALCADTSRARVGCLVFYVGYRNPALLAKAATTLDHISGGRFEFGIGSGWAEEEAIAYGYDFPSLAERFDMVEEAFPLVRSLLEEERTTHDGTFYRTGNASNVPAPVRGSIPMWVGGIGEQRTLRIAARHADGWNAPYVSPEEFARLGGVLDRWCEAEGRDPAAIERTVNLLFHVVADPTRAKAVEEQLREQWSRVGGGIEVDRILGGALIGSTEQAVERIAAYVAAGATGINVALRAPWDDDALDAYLTEVVPVGRSMGGTPDRR